MAFNILLAGVPFLLMLAAGLGYLLGESPDGAARIVEGVLLRVLPAQAGVSGSMLDPVLEDVARTRAVFGISGAAGFLWFSTRLFGSLRSVLAEVFDIETMRGIIAGKWFDVKMTVYSSILLVAYLGLSAYLALATSRGIDFLVAVGLREDLMGGVEYVIGRAIAFAFIVAIFWALYKYLPHRHIRWQQATVGALSTAILFEVARNAWTALTRSYDPGSVYGGTLYALVSLVFWTYYSALIFILGAEISQAYELRRVRRMQRESLES